MKLPLAAIRNIVGPDKVFSEPMSRHTSFRIGGKCTFAMPGNAEAMQELMKLVFDREVPYFVLGNGTNVLCGDDGWDGLVIMTRGLNDMKVRENRMVLGCGTNLSRAAANAGSLGLGGMEFAHGIPGSVGGAVAMNAGAYGGQMSDIVCRTLCLMPDKRLVALEGETHKFGYRHSVVTENPGAIVLATEVVLTPGDREEIQLKMQELGERRRASQPLNQPSAGSVFKRPEGHFVGTMVQECGLKGRTIGGARVSRKHAGFIVNVGDATARDVLELIEVVRSEVMAKFGVALACEIRPLGLGREEI